MLRKKPNTFYCFSPPVMIATFIIEISFALYTLYRYKCNKLAKLLIATLVCLAIFQFVEFFVCTTGNSYSELLSRIGFMSITMLPPLGIHILVTLKKFRRSEYLVAAAYTCAALFITYFLFVTHSLTHHACQGNYVIFGVNPKATILYGFYYHGFTVSGLALSAYQASKTTNKKLKQALYGMSIGYAAFIIPAATANLVDPATVRAIPSIMCGFAVLLALAIVTIVLPNAGTPKKK